MSSSPAFKLTVKVSHQHYERSQMIQKLEPLTVSNNAVALALREALDSAEIPFETLYAVIDSAGLGIYFKISRKDGDQEELFQAFCEDEMTRLGLVEAYQQQEPMTLEMEFFSLEVGLRDQAREKMERQYREYRYQLIRSSIGHALPWLFAPAVAKVISK